MNDVLIKDTTIIDGTKNNKYEADILISEGKIKKIGKLSALKANIVINDANLYTSPGFIDINNHSDTYLTIFTIPTSESLLKQGITTIIGGNCGSSLAPLVNKDIIQSIQKWADIKTINLNWLTMREFLNEVERKKLSVNFATLVGHSTLRRGLIGDEVRNLSTGELSAMKKMLRDAPNEG